MIMAETICEDCKYRAITWHVTKDNINECRKCGGKLEIIAIEKSGAEQ